MLNGGWGICCSVLVLNIPWIFLGVRIDLASSEK